LGKVSGDDFARNKTMRQYNKFQAIQCNNYIYICIYNIILHVEDKLYKLMSTPEKNLRYI